MARIAVVNHGMGKMILGLTSINQEKRIFQHNCGQESDAVAARGSGQR